MTSADIFKQLYVIGSIGSTALYLSRQLIAGNLARCALALGFEKMQVFVSHLF